jgi:hypothetical protein
VHFISLRKNHLGATTRHHQLQRSKAGKRHGYIPEHIGDAPCITTRQIPLLGKKKSCAGMFRRRKWVKMAYFRYGSDMFFSKAGFLIAKAFHSSGSILSSPFKSACLNVCQNLDIRLGALWSELRAHKNWMKTNKHVDAVSGARHICQVSGLKAFF